MVNKQTLNKRNILLIGKTGNGKSALANVLVDSEQAEVFKESDKNFSETKQAKSETFEITYGSEKFIYQIIDTGGLLVDEENIFLNLGEAIELLNGEINQILFLVGSSRFSKEEVVVYNMFKNIIFFDRDSDISKYTTVVRTKFSDFEDRDECEIERRMLEKKIPDDIHIIYVDNPPLKGNENKIKLNKETRKASKEILMRHLLDYCRKNYRPGSIQLINDRINDHVMMEKEIEKEEDDLWEQIRQAEDFQREKLLQKQINEIKLLRREKEKKTSEGAKRGLIDVINQAGDNWKRAVEIGVEQGNKVIPLVGGAVGGILGTGVGAIGTAFSALGYVLARVTGGEI